MTTIRRTAILLMACLGLAATLFAGPTKLDHELAKRSKDKSAAGQKIRVIIQHYTTVVSSDVDTVEKKHNGRVLKNLSGIKGLAAEVTLGELNGLSDEQNVAHVSLDAVIETSGGLARTVTGAADASKDPYKATGAGIGVAVIDSGFADRSDLHDNIKKVVDFVQDGNTAAVDPFGHGTHVAGIIGGEGKSDGGRYKGIAPNVRLVDLRVLDPNGKGYTSDVIAAIEWAIANRNAKGTDGKPLNIRVLNLSLGHRPYESASSDPLTVECRKAVQSGLVQQPSFGIRPSCGTST